jgi:hypothetical protein
LGLATNGIVVSAQAGKSVLLKNARQPLAIHFQNNRFSSSNAK